MFWTRPLLAGSVKNGLQVFMRRRCRGNKENRCCLSYLPLPPHSFTQSKQYGSQISDVKAAMHPSSKKNKSNKQGTSSTQCIDSIGSNQEAGNKQWFTVHYVCLYIPYVPNTLLDRCLVSFVIESS